MRNLLPLFIIFLLSSCGKYTCEDFKTGEYAYADTAYADVKISRTITGQRAFTIQTKDGKEQLTKDIGEQTEVMTRNGTEVIDVYDVIWDGPCSYTMVFKSTSSHKDQFHTKYDTIRTTIKEITKKGYIFQAHLYEENPIGELIKID